MCTTVHKLAAVHELERFETFLLHQIHKRDDAFKAGEELGYLSVTRFT